MGYVLASTCQIGQAMYQKLGLVGKDARLYDQMIRRFHALQGNQI
jgi:hypothetical protein